MPETPVAVAGGIESISALPPEHQADMRVEDPHVREIKPEIYMVMLDTAETVAVLGRADRSKVATDRSQLSLLPPLESSKPMPRAAASFTGAAPALAVHSSFLL